MMKGTLLLLSTVCSSNHWILEQNQLISVEIPQIIIFRLNLLKNTLLDIMCKIEFNTLNIKVYIMSNDKFNIY